MAQVRSFARRLAALAITAVLSSGGLYALEREQQPPAPNAACDAVELLTPTDGDASVSCPITFSWSAASDGSGYQLVVKDSENRIVVQDNTFQTSVVRFLPPDIYSWYVISKGALCTDAQSEVFQFRVTSCCPEAGPTLLLPLDEAKLLGPVTFTWTSVQNTSDYQVTVFDAFGDRALQADVSSTSYTDLNEVLGPGDYTWNVVAMPDGCSELESDETRSMRILDPCPDSPPVPINPMEDDEKVSPITFAWSSVEDASYVFRLFDAQGLEVYVKELSGQTLTRSLDPGTWSWSVDAVVEGCDTVSSTEVGFRVVVPCPSDAPEPVSPVGSIVESPVPFFWTGVAGAEAYRVTISLDGEESAQKTVIGTSTSFELGAESYTWRVEALAANCDPTESDEVAFRVIEAVVCPEAAPTLLSPSDESEQGSSVRLIWSAVENATQYRVVGTRNGTGLLSQLVASTFLDLNLSPGEYRWFVIAIAEGCDSLASEVWDFTVLDVGPVCPSSGPTLGQPADGAELNATSVNFSWSSVSGATKYVIRVFSANTLFKEESTDGTSRSISLAPGIYTWNVIAIVPDCDPVTSVTRRFAVVQGTCPSFGPALVSPLAGAKKNSPIKFSWSAVPGAESYRFVLATANKIVANQTLSGKSLEVPVAPGDYLWWVEALAGNCETQSSERRLLTVSATSSRCPRDRPRLISPEPGDEAGSPVTLVWSAVQDSSRYRVVLVDEGGSVIERETTSTNLSVELPAGEYDWSVEAISDGCLPVPSERSFFRIVCNRGAPVLSSPAGGAEVISPVTFSWSPVSGASRYLLQIYLNGNLFIDKKLEGTLISLELRPGAYKWFVAALFEDCPPEASDAGEFEVPESGPCPTIGPSLITPENESEPSSSKVRFEWTPVSDAYGYLLLMSRGQDRFVAAAKTELTAVELELGPGSFRWRVVALFERCDFLESEVYSFVIPEAGSCDNETVALVAPEKGATLTPPVSFMWTGVDGAVGYVLVLVPASGSPTPVAKTTSTSHTVDDLRPGKYEWFVLAVFDRCRPTESEHRGFEIPFSRDCDRRGPFLRQPRDFERNLSSPVQFSWTPVTDAVGYQVWIQAGDGPATPATPVTTASEVEIELPPGTYRWFVQVFFESCASVRSAVLSFHVGSAETIEPCGVTTNPDVRSIGAASSGEAYLVFWRRVANASSYEIQEADNPLFRNAESQIVPATSARFRHKVARRTAFYYRVRGLDECDGEPGPFSAVIRVVVDPEDDPGSSDFDFVTELGDDDPIIQEIQPPGGTGGSNLSAGSIEANPTAGQGRRRPVTRPVVEQPDLDFVAQSDASWISLSPSSGAVPDEGLVLTATANPENLPPGTSTATVTVTTSPPSETSASESSTLTFPVSVSLTTPLAPATSSEPGLDSKIIPVVSHSSTSGTSTNVSDIAVSNLSADPRSYALTFRPTDADVEWRTAQLQLDPGQTAALDDVVATWFGAEEGETTLGTLEIRSLDSSSTASDDDSTVASGINFFSAIEGSVGGLIPAIPF